MSSNNGSSLSSTVKSYIDQATGAIQSALGSVAGSDYDEAPGESENEHTTEKLGSLSQDPDTDPEPNTGATGKWDQTIGSAKESLGNLIGNEDLRKSGIDQNQSGKAQEAKAQLQDLSQGAADRAQGALGTVSAVMTGDRDAEERYRRIHDEGKARQRAAEADIENKGSY